VPDLEEWASKYGFSRDRLKVCAYTGAVTAYPPRLSGSEDFSYRMAFWVSSITLWIYVADNYIDNFNIVTCNEPEWLSRLASQLVYILAPLGPEPPESFGLNLPVAKMKYLDTVNSPDRVYQESIALRQALLHLKQMIAGGNSKADEYRASLFTKQAYLLLKTMYLEIITSSNFGRSSEYLLPDMEEYKWVGAVSIGMPMLAAMVAALDETPRKAWETNLRAMISGGAIARLSNDTGSIYQEFATVHFYNQSKEKGIKATGIGIE
jgi:hypothetical protein